MHFFLEVDTEQERRLKRMEETIRALQAGNARPDARYGDCSLFPGMRLPPKFKIPEFKTYEGTTGLCHHLRHYRGKMLQYWEYEEFVIHSFQDSLSGSVLDWFMPLKAEDIPTWEDLSRNGRRGKEVSVNAVNTAHQVSQQYSMNFTSAPPVAPSYARMHLNIGLYPLPNQSTIPHYRLHPHLRCRRSSSTIMPLLHPKPLNTNPRFLGLLSRHNEPRPRKVNRAVQRNHDPAGNTRPCRSHFPTFTGASINMITVCTSREGEGEQGWPSPFVIEYVPAEAAVRFTDIDAPPAPLVIDIPTREPYSNDRVPWTYEGGVGNLE
ncbi:hypothetical protein CRG98_019975 [Punica granatum]|uniref:Retrotransposon gag domain-containing protein n=1 Tax=Punica granatum TaxID=22663 RepID=A0A2I0JTL0_PUNGR|nr:hypothetical protein CRG98_019975 [Punica granatum]